MMAENLEPTARPMKTEASNRLQVTREQWKMDSSMSARRIFSVFGLVRMMAGYSANHEVEGKGDEEGQIGIGGEEMGDLDVHDVQGEEGGGEQADGGVKHAPTGEKSDEDEKGVGEAGQGAGDGR